MKKLPLVSVVVTTKNEAGVLEKLLRSINRQTYKAVEIIVVDNDSSDKTKEIARKYTKKVFDFGPERSAQRNFGVKKSKADYLLFLDADMELSAKVIEECVRKIEENEKIGAVVIPEKSVANTFWEKVKAYERSFYNEKGDPVTDAARFFAREAYKAAGGYDESITGPEDWDLPETVSQLGYKIGRIKAKIYHYERIKNLPSLLKKKYYYALKSHRYLIKHKTSPISAKTIYFLRPVFYKNWKRILSHPRLSLVMFLMLFLELVTGGLGYVAGRVKNK